MKLLSLVFFEQNFMKNLILFFLSYNNYLTALILHQPDLAVDI